MIFVYIVVVILGYAFLLLGVVVVCAGRFETVTATEDLSEGRARHSLNVSCNRGKSPCTLLEYLALALGSNSNLNAVLSPHRSWQHRRSMYSRYTVCPVQGGSPEHSQTGPAPLGLSAYVSHPVCARVVSSRGLSD